MARELKDLVVGLDIGTAKSDGRRGRGDGRWRAAHRRARQRPGAWPQARCRRQHRRNRAVDPAGLEGSRDDGRLQDHARLHRHHRLAHPRSEQHRHGDRARQGSDACGCHPRRRDGEGHQHPERPAFAPRRAAGVRDRRPRGEGADRHERRPARGESAHRHRRAERGPRTSSSACAAAASRWISWC